MWLTGPYGLVLLQQSAQPVWGFVGQHCKASGLSSQPSETKQPLQFWGERRAPAMLEPRGIASKGAWHLRGCSTSAVSTSQGELWYSS